MKFAGPVGTRGQQLEFGERREAQVFETLQSMGGVLGYMGSGVR